MTSKPVLAIDDINLSELEFWARPLAEREGAFHRLRTERPLAFFAEPEVQSDLIPVGPGYYAVTKYDDILEVSKNPELYCSGRGATSIADMPDFMLDFFGSMINMDDPRHARLHKLVSDLGASRRADPTDDLTSALVNTEVDGERLSDSELGSFFILLVVAGNETTRNAIAHGLDLFTKNPGQRDFVSADIATRMPGAIEEIVRVASPVVWMRRTATRSGALHGVDFDEGSKFILYYWSANRDTDIFTDPYRFDVSRSPNPHLGFGGPGPHFCLGAHLARREIGVMWKELLSRAPQVRATAEPDRLLSSFINGIKHLEFTV